MSNLWHRRLTLLLVQLALLLAIVTDGALAAQAPPPCPSDLEDTLAGVPPTEFPPGLEVDDRWSCVMTHSDLGELIVDPQALDARTCVPPSGQPLPGGVSVDAVCAEVTFAFAPKLRRCLSEGETACYEQFAWVVPAMNVRFVPNYWALTGDWRPLMLWKNPAEIENDGPCDNDSSLCSVQALRLVSLSEWQADHPSDAYVETAAVVLRHRDGLGDVRHAWFSVPLHVTGPNKRPSADFVFEATGVPGEIRFTSTSTDPEGDLLDLRWDFGDGKTGTGGEVTHVYGKVGFHTVTLTATDLFSNSDQRSETIFVEGPLAVIEVETFPGTLAVSFSGQDSTPSTGSDIVQWAWDLGDGSTDQGELILHEYFAACVYPVSLTITDDSGAEASAHTKVTVGDTPVPAFTWTQDPDDRLTVEFDASASTGVGLLYEWDFGDETSGADVLPTMTHTFPDLGPWKVKLTITDIHGCSLDKEHSVELGKALVVEVTADPAEFKLNEGPAENEFSVKVDVTNKSTVPIESVTITGGNKPLALTSLTVDPEVALEPVTPLPSPLLGTIAPTKTKSVTYKLRAVDRVHALIETLVTGNKEGRTVVGRGAGEVNVTRDVLIEVRVRIQQRPFWNAGQTVRLEGTVKNVSDDKMIGVVAFPITGGNAGNGILFVERGGSRTPEGVEGWVLAAGQEIEVSGLLPTAHAFFATNATVRYVVRAWVHEDDGTKTNADKQVEIVTDEEAGYASDFSVRLRPEPPPTDDRLATCGGWYFSCGLLTGLGNFATGIWELGRLVGTTAWSLGNYGYRAIAWVGYMLGELSLVLQEDQEALDRIAEEIALDLQSVVDAGALTLEQGQVLAVVVKQAMIETLDKWTTIYREGDLETLTFEVGRLAGENPDMVFEAVVATRLAVKIGNQVADASTATRQAVDRAADAQRASLPERIAAAEGDELSKSGAFAAGDELDYDLVHDAWGAARNEVEAVQDIAQAENAIIAFRSRAIEAAKLIQDGLAWPKPELMKIKSINQIDIDYLGYRPSRKGVVELVEPPVNWSLTGPELENALDVYMGVLKGRHPELADPDLFKAVRSRLKTRTEEFPIYSDLFDKWSRNGIEIGFNYKSQGIGEDIAKGVQDTRPVRVTEITDGVPDPSRKYFEIEMGGPDGGGFRAVTGDIDFMAILNPDGTMILDLAKRLRIYEHLQKLVGMQHGESLAFLNPGRPNFLRAAAEGGEALAVVHPNRKLRAGHFVEVKSILPDSPNAALRAGGTEGDFILFSGAEYALRSQLGISNRLVLRSLTEAFNAFFRRRLFFLPGYLHRFIDGLFDDQVPPRFDRNPGASVIQPDGEGGLVVWTEEHGWRPITLGEALDLGGPDVLDLLPQTTLSTDAPAGTFRLGVTTPEELGMSADSPWFQPGDVVVLDPGGPNEAFGTVAGLGSLILEDPLEADHEKGEIVTIARLAGCDSGDSDGDGTLDCHDLCPDDPDKIEPGLCGCGLSDADADQDGTPNCDDLCPDDPNKIEPGTCGCGVSDIDADEDGTPNCDDLCPGDPSKIEPGTCGCGVSDIDADEDGTPNCDDLCPDDPDKVEPGACGCDFAEVPGCAVVVTVLPPVGDAFVSRGHPHRNEGANGLLLVRDRRVRTLVEFDLEEIATAVGENVLQSATLELHIVRRPANFGHEPTRGIAVHRLVEGPWLEGRGHIYRSKPRDRGDGPGATWRCAVDDDIANRRADCHADFHWNMGSDPVPSDREDLVNRQAGSVLLDVTADVLRWLDGEPGFGWLLQVGADEGTRPIGTVAFSSREGEHPPTLRLEVVPSAGP